jgi:AraC-like DNA-binding protein
MIAEHAPGTGRITFHRLPLHGIDAMTACTSRSFPRHTHDQFGVGVVDAGVHASLSDCGQVKAGAGDLIFVNPGEVHDGHAVRGQARTWRMFYFDPALMAQIQTDLRDGAPAASAFCAPVHADERLRHAFNAAFEFTRRDAAQRNAMAFETALMRLAVRLHANLSQKLGSTTKSSAPIHLARAMIDTDPAAPHSLRELAFEQGISRYQLVRAFARELRLTPHAYILQRRVALARRLIRAGEPVADAAIAAGFCDQSHLTRMFVRQFGITPARYGARAV